jgi:hypothetical protein
MPTFLFTRGRTCPAIAAALATLALCGPVRAAADPGLSFAGAASVATLPGAAALVPSDVRFAAEPIVLVSRPVSFEDGANADTRGVHPGHDGRDTRGQAAIAVPEPGTALLTLAGFLMISLTVRRRQQHQAMPVLARQNR